MDSNIPREDHDDYERWAEQAAADEEAELTYRRMLEDEYERIQHPLENEDESAPPAVETDLF